MAEGMQTSASAPPAGQVSVASKAAAVRSVSPKGKPTVWLAGRVEDSHQVIDNKTHTPVLDREGRPVFETVIVIPAVDQYSYPSRFRIMSKSNLGGRRAGPETFEPLRQCCARPDPHGIGGVPLRGPARRGASPVAGP